MRVRNRIKELRLVKGSELMENPKNWRGHGESQRAALRGILDEVGLADALIARETDDGLMLIDGHLRADEEPDTDWPVLVLDVTEEEADKLLATIDPIAAMAEAGREAYQKLLEGVSTKNQDLSGLFKAVSDGDLKTLKASKGGGAESSPPDDNYKEQYGVVVICSDEVHQQEVYEYLSGEGYNCKVVVT